MQIPVATIYNLPTARMYTLICSLETLREAVEQPPGRCRGKPFGRTFETRTVTSTALREDLQNSDGHTDSPPGGTRELRLKLRSLYRVAHIRCHLSGRASPSRTSSCRNPDCLTTLRNSFHGRERRSQIMHVMCMRARDDDNGSPFSSFYRPRQGVGWWRKYQNTHATCPT